MIDFNGICWLVIGIAVGVPWGALAAALILYYLGKNRAV